MTGDVTPAACDPQAPSWGGLSWSRWLDFDKAHRGHLIPATPGIYRFQTRGEPGLLYIGKSGNAVGRRARLDDLARGLKHHPPGFYLNWRTAGLAKRPHRGHYVARTCASARTPDAMSRSRGRWRSTRIRRSGGPSRQG